MGTTINVRILLLSALHVIIAALLLFLVDVGLYYFINFVIPRGLEWINSLSFFMKILLLIVTEVILLAIAKQISLLGGLIFEKLPENAVTIILTVLLSVVNTITIIILLWKMPEKYNFWIVSELLIITSFVCFLNAIVFPFDTQMKEYAKG